MEDLEEDVHADMIAIFWSTCTTFTYHYDTCFTKVERYLFPESRKFHEAGGIKPMNL